MRDGGRARNGVHILLLSEGLELPILRIGCFCILVKVIGQTPTILRFILFNCLHRLRFGLRWRQIRVIARVN